MDKTRELPKPSGYPHVEYNTPESPVLVVSLTFSDLVAIGNYLKDTERFQSLMDYREKENDIEMRRKYNMLVNRAENSNGMLVRDYKRLEKLERDLIILQEENKELRAKIKEPDERRRKAIEHAEKVLNNLGKQGG